MTSLGVKDAKYRGGRGGEEEGDLVKDAAGRNAHEKSNLVSNVKLTTRRKATKTVNFKIKNVAQCDSGVSSIVSSIVSEPSSCEFRGR